jgi:general secretion pathway protein E
MAVLAQRLVRVLCPDCRVAYVPTSSELNRIGLTTAQYDGPLYRAKGCRSCRNTGYRGRTAVHELMIVDDAVRDLVMKKADASSIRRVCSSKGMKVLRQDGAERVRAGQTTIEELLRVTQEDII